MAAAAVADGTAPRSLILSQAGPTPIAAAAAPSAPLLLPPPASLVSRKITRAASIFTAGFKLLKEP
jgi:hypothetical protein